MQALITDLLSITHKYYSIGLPNYQEAFPGFKELKSLLDKKINTLMTEKAPPPWPQVISSLKAEFPNEQIYDLAACQAPSFKLAVPLATSEDSYVLRRQSINLALSLLGPYYTIYLEEEYFYHPKDSEQLELKSFSFNRQFHKEVEIRMFNSIESLLSRHYPSYQHVDYKLTQVKIQGGIPYGDDIDGLQTEYPLFDFVFGKY